MFVDARWGSFDWPSRVLRDWAHISNELYLKMIISSLVYASLDGSGIGWKEGIEFCKIFYTLLLKTSF